MATKKKKGAKKAGKARTAKKTAKKRASVRRSATTKKAAGGKRRPNAAFMKPLQPSPGLARVVGEKPLPRTEVVKKVWAYIKKHGLQERRNIHADDTLKPIFGGKKMVTMFEMASLLSKHLG